MPWWTSLAVTLLVLAAGIDARQPTSQSEECVDVKSNGRLHRGTSFRADIGRGLEFRLTVERESRASWIVSIGPRATIVDYMWPVSPPLQTAPHHFIGAAYHLTAVESAQLTPRRYRFVLTPAEYERVVELIRHPGPDAPRLTAEYLERMGRGTLLLRITGYAPTPGVDALDWITFRGRACTPTS